MILSKTEFLANKSTFKEMLSRPGSERQRLWLYVFFHMWKIDPNSNTRTHTHTHTHIHIYVYLSNIFPKLELSEETKGG
jgi:hypothetical protein